MSPGVRSYPILLWQPVSRHYDETYSDQKKGKFWLPKGKMKDNEIFF